MKDIGVKAGDIILTYMYQGEGYIDAWANGKWLGDQENQQIFSNFACTQADKPPDLPTCFVDEGDKEWWVLIKTSSGKQGWIKGAEGFDGADACA